MDRLPEIRKTPAQVAKIASVGVKDRIAEIRATVEKDALDKLVEATETRVKEIAVVLGEMLPDALEVMNEVLNDKYGEYKNNHVRLNAAKTIMQYCGFSEKKRVEITKREDSRIEDLHEQFREEIQRAQSAAKVGVVKEVKG